MDSAAQQAPEYLPLKGRAIAFGSGDRLRVMAQHPCLSFRPSEPGFRPASESRNPVIKAVRAFMPAVDYWVPARASPVEPGSLGRDDNSYAIALPFRRRYRTMPPEGPRLRTPAKPALDLPPPFRLVVLIGGWGRRRDGSRRSRAAVRTQLPRRIGRVL
jgi:hypothetical protein